MKSFDFSFECLDRVDEVVAHDSKRKPKLLEDYVPTVTYRYFHMLLKFLEKAGMEETPTLFELYTQMTPGYGFHVGMEEKDMGFIVTAHKHQLFNFNKFNIYHRTVEIVEKIYDHIVDPKTDMFKSDIMITDSVERYLCKFMGEVKNANELYTTRDLARDAFHVNLRMLYEIVYLEIDGTSGRKDNTELVPLKKEYFDMLIKLIMNNLELFAPKFHASETTQIDSFTVYKLNLFRLLYIYVHLYFMGELRDKRQSGQFEWRTQQSRHTAKDYQKLNRRILAMFKGGESPLYDSGSFTDDAIKEGYDLVPLYRTMVKMKHISYLSPMEVLATRAGIYPKAKRDKVHSIDTAFFLAIQHLVELGTDRVEFYDK